MMTSKSVCRMTAGQNVQLLWERTDFDFTVGPCLLSDGHNTLSDGDLCLSYDSGAKRVAAIGADTLTSLSDRVWCQMDTRQCPVVTSKSFCRTTVSKSGLK